MTEEPRVVIATFMLMHEAVMAQSALHGSGIDSMIDQPYGGTIVPHHQLFSGISLLVKESDAAAALSILDLADEDQR